MDRPTKEETGIGDRWIILAVLFVARFALGFQFQAAGSVTPVLLDEFGSGYTGLGTLVGLFMIPGLIVAIPSGFMGQRYGDKRVVLISLLTMAVGGAVSGGVYMYDQSRRDDRTQMLADAIGSNKQPSDDGLDIPEPQKRQNQSTPPNQTQVTVGDIGQSRLKNFVGDWDLSTWSLAADGSRLAGSGVAKGLSASANAARISPPKSDTNQVCPKLADAHNNTPNVRNSGWDRHKRR